MASIWYYSIFLFLGAWTMLAMAGTALFRRRSPLVIYFAFFCLAVAVYAVGYGMEVSRVDPFAIRFWSRFEYMGMPYISSFILLFVIHFVSSGRKVPAFFATPLILMSSLILIVRQTNPYHHKFYANQYYETFGSLVVMTFDKAIWYWIFAGYNILCILGSVVLLAFYAAKAPRVFRKQGLWLLLGTLIPLFPYVAYVGGLVPRGIDIVPAAIILASCTFYVAIFRHDVFTLVPVGRDRLIETMSEAVLVMNSAGQIADVNPAALQALNSEQQDPVGRYLTDAFPLLGKLDDEVLRIKNENRIWELKRTPINSRGKKDEGYIVIGHDVTEREELVARLERMAREDSLTGLLNRQSWDEAVSTELSRLSRHGRFGSLIYLDLDGFKSVNDTHGHAAGDNVLITVGRVLREGVRRPDLIGRYGGEEFVLFLPEIHPEAAVDVAERLRVDLYEAIEADMSVNVSVTGSFGVSGGIISDDVRLEELIEKADQAMYESKRTGKNRVSWNRN